MNPNAIKRKLAGFLDVLGINSAGFALQRLLLFPFIRVVNYHDIAPEHVSNFESHLKYYSSKFVNVNETALREFLSGTPWPYEKPGLILSFDDGLASHSETVVPLLENYGFTGWFFVPAERVNLPVEAASVTNGERPASAADIKFLDERHVVGCHTATHCRLSADLSDERLRYEIVESKQILGSALGREVDIFCWVGGEEFTYSRAAANLVNQAYNLGFMTNNAVVRPGTNPMQIQRTNIEAENPMPLVRFQLSGFLDLLYLPKRRRVNRLTR